ncbi:MAG: Na/Pi cotransporter family protein [Breznakibacter sp.]
MEHAPTGIWSSDSALLVTMGLVGGVGLFLLGMQMLSQGIRNLAGKQMRHFLSGVSKNRIYGAGFGVFFTVLFQSSSASTVVLVSFVDAGLLSFTQALPVVLGTAFGTTITAQLVAFKVGKYALFAIGFGFILSILSKGRWKHLFETLLSLGLLFYGMDMMSQSMKPLQDYQPFIHAMGHITHPVPALLLGFVVTALIQSSAAFIGILIMLGSTGLLDLGHCLPMILGSNIGTTLTALISSISASRQAQKVAVANVMFKIATAFIFIWFLSQWEWLVLKLMGETPDFGRAVANAHTFYNLVLMLGWLPFTEQFGRFISRYLLPDKKKDQFTLKYLTDAVLDSPTISVALLKKELLGMGQVVVRMVDASLGLFIGPNEIDIDELKRLEQETDSYRQKINDFWLRSAKVSSREMWSAEVYQLLHLVNELEQVADLVSVNIIHQAEKYQNIGVEFSDAGKDELTYYHSRCVKQLNRALDLVENRDYDSALKMKKKYREYAYLAFDLEMSHYQRLFSPQSLSVESSKIHLELLNLYRIITSRATNFGRLVLRESETA